MLYISEGLRDLTGYEVADVLGNARLSYGDLIHPDDRKKVWDEIEHALEQRRTYQVEYRLVRADGESVWVWEQGRGAFDERGKVRFLDGVVIDANARVAEAASLRNSQETLQAVLDVTPFPVAFVDVDQTVIEFWSKSAQDLLGYSAVTAREWYNLAYPDPEYRQQAVDRWLSVAERARAVPGTSVNGGEYRVTRADGSTLDCELYAAYVADRLVVTLNDITERKRARTSCGRARSASGPLSSRLPSPSWCRRAEPYQYANRAARQLYGETPQRQLVGRMVVDLTHPDHRNMVRDRMQTVREHRAVSTIRFTVLDPGRQSGGDRVLGGARIV